MRTKAEVVLALRLAASLEGGRTPSSNSWDRERPHGAPAMSTIRSHFGSWSEACVAAGLVPRERGGQHELADWKLDDTAVVIRELARGRTLTQLGAERGITGQALGRRVRRYQRALGLPVVNRERGRPRPAASGAERR